ncbi:MAG: penicillin-binding protein 2 [Pseudomonadota bacterium]|nr:penicillin-binding protein 2 [Pseudomonadota bacterium]
MSGRPSRHLTIVKLEGERKQAVETGRNRLLVAGAVFASGFLMIAIRLVDVALVKSGDEPNLARERASEQIRTGRADIVDRNGVLLATTLATASLYANPKTVPDAKRAARRLVKVLPDLNQANVLAKLTSKRRFVWLKRHLTPEQQYEVNRLGVPGFDFQREERRVYPLGRLAAHILGHTDIDNRGLAGIERYFDEDLRARPTPLVLSVDVRIQNIVTHELRRARREYRAAAAAAIVLDARNGEIVAMASLPDFDPNRPADIIDAARFDRNALGVYEMGSTLKIFTTAMALETGAVKLTGGYDATRPIRVSPYWIRDHGAKRRWLSVPEIFIYSSNIGSARMAMAVGGKRQRAFMGRFGLLSRPSIQLAEVGAPLTPTKWRDINTMTIGFGHGIAVSPVQLVGGVAAVVNGGVFFPPSLIVKPKDAPIIGTRVVSTATSDKMRRLMRLAVQRGTGRRAAATGYMVGGKTGTAEKITARRYSRKALLSSFVGAFPIQAPRYVVFAMLDEPRGTRRTRGYATGGMVAAPIVSNIVSRIGPALGIPTVDEEARKLKRRMAVRVMTMRNGVRRIASE